MDPVRVLMAAWLGQWATEKIAAQIAVVAQQQPPRFIHNFGVPFTLAV